MRACRTGRGEIRLAQGRPDEPPVQPSLEPVEHAAEQPELCVRLRPVEAPRDIGQGRPGLHQGRGNDERPRGGIGVSERRGVHDDPCHERRGQGAVARVERDAEARRQQRHHLAGGRAGRLDPVGLARRRVRRVVVDDDARQPIEQLAVPHADLANAIKRPAVRHDEEVVRPVRARVRREALDSREKAVQRRHRIGAHRVGRSAERLDQCADAERGAKRVGVRVLVAYREHATGVAHPLDDGVRDRRRPRGQVDGHR